jgi:hypothetical protein
MKITELTGVDLDYLIAVATTAKDNGQPLRLSQDDRGLIVKRGGGIWIAPIGYNVDQNYNPKG